MENSLETCTCRHLPAFQPVTFPTAFQSTFCWSLGPRLALESVTEVLAVLVGLPLRLGC